MLTGYCRWHILANEVVPAASAGPGAVSQWFTDNLGGVQTRQEIQRIEDDGPASVVFTRAHGDLGCRAEPQRLGRRIPL